MYEQSAEEASINCNFCYLIILRKTTFIVRAVFNEPYTLSWKFTISPRVGMSSASTIFNIWAFTIQH